jgi:hypothetical protein
MPLQTITLSSASVPGVSAPSALNWRSAEPATVSILVSTTATFTGGVKLEYSLDDLMLVGGSSLAFWQGVSSAIGQPAQIFNLATAGADGIQFQFLTPVAAVRMNSTALSSGPLTMKTMQGEGG